MMHNVQDLPHPQTALGVCVLSLLTIPRNAEQMVHEGASKSFQTGHLEQELQMVQISATRCGSIIIL